MLPRTLCTRGHRLETKQVTGGVLGVRVKHCNQCRRVLNRDDWRHSCKSCHFHLCATCVETPACQRGHPLVKKMTSGSIMHSLGMSSAKHCAVDRVELTAGSTRWSCKACDFHVCDGCMQRVFSARAAALRPPAPAPSAPLLAGAGYPPHCPPCAPAAPAAAPVSRRDSAASGPGGPAPGPQLRACKYGTQCFRKNSEHLAKFAHPGDRMYRYGMVVFEENAMPEFESLWQLFKYHDPDESGFLSVVDFRNALDSCRVLATGLVGSESENWTKAGGVSDGYLNFRQFVAWAKEFLPEDFPVGLDTASASDRPCRFRLCSSGGARCPCPGFEAADDAGLLCKCGHKASMHRSDTAEAGFEAFSSMNRACHTMDWTDTPGLVRIEDDELLAKLQEALDHTHKPKDNWTRDRGCALHGVNGCDAKCCSKNKAPVPTRYKLLTAYRNQNEDLWQKYSMLKTAIREECRRPRGLEDTLPPMTVHKVTTSGMSLSSDLDEECNEYYLFHGSSSQKCTSIASTNFRTDLAGAGATWKEKGKAVGTPLYGFGVYFAERITKADEYSKEVDEDDGILPEDAEGEFYTVLVCRVMCGKTNVVTTNEIEVKSLREDVFAGPYHSVMGDRVSVLNKPYREVVVYEKDQCFPEFLLVYSRAYG